VADLGPEAFKELLAWLDADKERAGEKYEALRRRLVIFFEGRKCGWESETLSDRTLDVVARKLAEGQKIHSSESFSYCYGVARNVYLEFIKHQKPAMLEREPALPQAKPSSDESRLHCLDRCLSQLPPESRKLILDFYEGTRHVKIENRRRLAIGLGITLNALRIRTHTIRSKLETCVRGCVVESGQT
jgi:DNA-directed RNA polymerase specialized sigma24 family protein